MNKIENELPKIICHMMRALGGKIAGRASNTYCAFLRRLHIFDVMAGQEQLDCRMAVRKLNALFGIETFMLSSGMVS